MSHTPAKPATLYLVATPIGALADITYRAVEILRRVDIIAAEDTRKTRILLNHYDIRPARLVSYHSHNLARKTSELTKQLEEGKSIALVTDAGTPGISDPGAVLTRSAIDAGAIVCPAPGATAILPALTASGFPTHRFVFEGFLPRKKGRRAIMESWKAEPRTIVFFESPARLIKTLEQISQIVGQRKICVAREITKKFEEFTRGDIDEIILILKQRSSIKGEITVIIAPKGF